MTAVVGLTTLLIAVLAGLVGALCVRGWRDARTEDPAMEELLRAGRLNYTYSKHAPVATYDQAKAVAAHHQAQARAKRRARKVAARERLDQAPVATAKVTPLRRAR
jgi:hypothetical protein